MKKFSQKNHTHTHAHMDTYIERILAQKLYKTAK